MRDSVTTLRQHGIQPSAQRVAVADYVLQTAEHPSADLVWKRVKARVPYISRATVYNTGLTLSNSIQITDGGAVNSASNKPGVAPGSNVTLYGTGFTDKTISATTGPLPTTLGGVTVYVNGFVAPLLYVSPTQIYGQLPFPIDGNITIRVTTANGFVERSL